MNRRVLLLIALLVPVLGTSLNGCGFHLRGQGQKLGDLPPLAVQGGNRAYARLTIERILGGPDGPLVANIEDAQVIIDIREDLIEERVLTINANAKVTEYEVAYLITFQLLDNDEEVIREPERIVLTGDYTFNAGVLLGKDSERDAVAQELMRQAAQKILRITYQSTLRR